MPKYRFTRDTGRHEGRDIHAAGEVIELSGSTLRHWMALGAVEEIVGKAAKPEAPVEPPAPPVASPDAPAPAPAPVAPKEPAHAPAGHNPGHGAKPVAKPAAKSAPTPAAKKGKGHSRK